MANLTVTINRNGSDLVVSGSAITNVTITVGGQSKVVTPDDTGAYTVTFPGLGDTTSGVVAKSSGKVVTVQDVTADVAGINTLFGLEDLASVKAERTSGSVIRLSGEFSLVGTTPLFVKCIREENEEAKTSKVHDRKWASTFENCTGTGHRFKLEPGANA
jgi:hypothetical protein